MAYGKNQLLLRREDRRLVTGQGRYVDDIVLPGMAHAAMVYSDHAHALVRQVDTARAARAPGVLAVLTGVDWAADGLGGVGPRYLPQMFGFGEALPIARPCLAVDRVRHVGERLAMVVAETRAQAEAAAAEVRVEIEPLPCAVTLVAATAEGAPWVHAERPDNVAYRLEMGDAAATDAAFAAAASVHRVEIAHPRVTACSMETRGGIGVYSPADDFYTLYTTTQNPHVVRAELAGMCLRIPESSLRVLCHDVGGGFGMKTSTFPEDALLLWASRRLGRPVKWICPRSDAMRSDEHGRGSAGHVEIALDGEGRLLALRARLDHDVGAYMVCAGPMPPIHTAKLLPGVYRLPAMDVRARAIFTHNPSVVPYRGAGRPEGIFAMESALDAAALALGIPPEEIRRRNFLRPEDLPHRTPAGFTYDTGAFEGLMDRCIALSDPEGFAARRERDARAGLLRGRGLGMYIHDTGAMNDQAKISFDPGGTVTVISGTTDTGQGHHTTFAGQVAERLGLDPGDIRVIQGDTDKVAFGRGSFASRSATMVGSAVELACDAIIEKGRLFAARLLEAEPERLVFTDGAYHLPGSNRNVTLSAVGAASFRPNMPVGDRVGLSATGAFAQTSPSFPNGCHICELTVDPQTGEVRIDRYVVVDDLGRMLNPALCEGQIHGAIAQGIGESLFERIVSDPEGGQLLSGSFLDYALPRADGVPSITADFAPIPCTTNPAGVKGAGEGGTVGSLAAIRRAVLDALAPLGVRDVAKPMTPFAVWSAIRDATA